MLAEPRRKQKWSADPRNTQWTNDESKFGHKMLEKMGWSKGKGLGANEDGNQDLIKIRLKSDNRGVGCTLAHDNNWVAHQDDFASLLADLNKQNNTEKVDSDLTNVSSLEEKSKFQKKRVHYKKFAKGKDLSRYKNADMDAIFGSSSHSATSTPTVLSENESSSSDSDTSNLVVNKEESTVEQESKNNITSQISYQEYFALKMKKIKSSSKEQVEVIKESTTKFEVETKSPKIKRKKKKSIKIESASIENTTDSKIVSVKKRKNKDKKSKTKNKKSKTC